MFIGHRKQHAEDPVSIITLLLASTAGAVDPGAASSTLQQITASQDAGARADAADDTAPAGNEIVVTGRRLRGEVLSEQPPIAEYDERDIQALGASSLTELLAALGPQVSSGRGRGGGPPLILVNGRRISNFRELSSYPPEAVQRVSILPEEVALQYGFPPDQRVVNIILRDNFASREVEVEYGQPDRGGYRQGELELTYLRIDGPDRLNANLQLQETTALTELERGVILTAPVLPGDPDPAAFRTLVAPSDSIAATLNWSRGLGVEGAGGSFGLSGRYGRSRSRSDEGLVTVLLTDPAGRTALRALPLVLQTRQVTDNYAAGASLDKPVGDWRLNATLDATLTDVATDVGNAPGLASLVDEAAAGRLPITGALPSPDPGGIDTARSRIINVAPVVTLSGRPVSLPAGRMSVTADASYSWQRIESSDTRSAADVQLTRGVLSSGLNVNLPVAARDAFLGALGDVSLQLGAGVDHLSDFGTLWDANLGLTWRPTGRLTLQMTYVPREAAPSLAQLGNPVIVTPNVPVFDFVTGRTALVTITRGGNPDLLAEQQRDFKASLSWQLPSITELIRDANIDVEYFRNRSRDVSASFPFLTPAIEAAFPARVLRDGAGQLIAIDQSPVTFARQDASRLRFALNLGGAFARDEAPRGGAGARPGGALGTGGGPGAMLRAGPPSGGRWRLTLDYTRELENTVLIAPGGPVLDLLDGDALTAGGISADRIGARLFGFYRGVGGRVAFDWSSPTEVRSTGVPGGSDLRFGSVSLLNLRVFGDLERLLPEREFLRGTRLSLFVNNVFDSRRDVRDEAGLTPARYQPFLLDPTGRFVGIELRKLFL